jgi:hypothetical protein
VKATKKGISSADKDALGSGNTDAMSLMVILQVVGVDTSV